MYSLWCIVGQTAGTGVPSLPCKPANSNLAGPGRGPCRRRLPSSRCRLLGRFILLRLIPPLCSPLALFFRVDAYHLDCHSSSVCALGGPAATRRENEVLFLASAPRLPPRFQERRTCRTHAGAHTCTHQHTGRHMLALSLHTLSLSHMHKKMFSLPCPQSLHLSLLQTHAHIHTHPHTSAIHLPRGLLPLSKPNSVLMC